MSENLLSMFLLLRLQAIILLLAIYTSVKPSAASDPSDAINKRENAIESTDLQSVRGTRSSDMTTLAFLDVPRDKRGAHGGHRRKKYYSSRRMYRRRHLHSHTSDSSSILDSTSSSQSVSDSDEKTGRRSKSSAKRNQKYESVYSQIRDLHDEHEEEKWQYGYVPIRRGDLMQFLRTANHSPPELGLGDVFVVDAHLFRDVALQNAVASTDSLQHDLV